MLTFLIWNSSSPGGLNGVAKQLSLQSSHYKTPFTDLEHRRPDLYGGHHIREPLQKRVDGARVAVLLDDVATAAHEWNQLTRNHLSMELSGKRESVVVKFVQICINCTEFFYLIIKINCSLKICSLQLERFRKKEISSQQICPLIVQS